jgi:cytochrome P450
MRQTITFAIHDLCLHPEYVEPLREELREGYSQFERTSLGLPLLDSFIKESARLTPVESSKFFSLPPSPYPGFRTFHMSADPMPHVCC